ncbi:2793_t:CDS:1, partial [Ambispora gerdemannii]
LLKVSIDFKKTLWEVSIDFKATLWEVSIDFKATLWEVSTDFKATSWKVSTDFKISLRDLFIVSNKDWATMVLLSMILLISGMWRQVDW